MMTLKREKSDILVPVHNDPQSKKVCLISVCLAVFYIISSSYISYFAPVCLNRCNCSPKTFVLTETTLSSNESAKH